MPYRRRPTKTSAYRACTRIRLPAARAPRVAEGVSRCNKTLRALEGTSDPGADLPEPLRAAAVQAGAAHVDATHRRRRQRGGRTHSHGQAAHAHAAAAHSHSHTHTQHTHTRTRTRTTCNAQRTRHEQRTGVWLYASLSVFASLGQRVCPSACLRVCRCLPCTRVWTLITAHSALSTLWALARECKFQVAQDLHGHGAFRLIGTGMELSSTSKAAWRH